MKSVLVLCIALGAHAAFAAEAKPASTWLKNFMAPTGLKTLSEESEVEKEQVCFQTSKTCPAFCNSDDNGQTCNLYAGRCCHDQYELQDMKYTRCHEDDYYRHQDQSDFDMSPGLSLSKCMQHRQLFRHQFPNEPGIPVDSVTPGLSWVGSFQATCYLNDDNLPDGCKTIVVEVQGSIFRLAEAIHSGSRTQLPVCDNPPNRRESDADKPAGSEAPAQAKALRAPAPAPTEVWTGPVEIYNGQIVGNSHPDKFIGGSYQFAWFYKDQLINTKSPSETAQLLTFQDDHHKFELLRERKPHY